MFNIAPKIIETLLSIYPDPDGDDFDEIATTCIVELQANMAVLNCFLHANRGKDMTDKKREKVTDILSELLFYTSILIHLNGLPPDLFDMDADAEDGIVHEVPSFDEVYFHSPLLLGTHLMGVCVDIGEYMWSDDFGSGEVETTSNVPAVGSAASTELEIPADESFQGFLKNLLEDAGPVPGEEDDTFFDFDEGDEVVPMISRLLAGLMIMAESCDIDLGIAMYNASVKTEI